MALDPTTPRSRRALLAAAAGGAAAVAASAAAPVSVLAVASPMLTETANTSADETSLTDSGDRTIAFKTSNVGVAPAIVASNAVGVATTPGETDTTDPGGITSASAVYAFTPDNTNAAPYWLTTFTAVYGWTPTTTLSSGFATSIWGDSEDVGVEGSGAVGVRGDGFFGMVAAGAQGGTGIRAWGYDGAGNDIALDVRGKAIFSKSGRSTIAAGHSTLKIYKAGVTFSSLVFAVLRTNRTNRWVRAVVPTTGSFTIYLNAAVTSSTYVVWFVLN